MYKKRAGCLAVLVSTVAFATAGTFVDEPPAPLAELASGPMAAHFLEPLQPCDASLAREELATPSLLQTFYAELGYRRLWDAPERRQALEAAIASLADDGLEPAHYALPQPPRLDSCGDLLISRQYLSALQHLSRGRVDQERIEPFWRAPDSINPDPRPSVLSLAWEGLDDIPGAFAAARPALPQYHRLREVLVRWRSQPLPNWPQLPDGPLLKPGQSDARIPLLRRRLSAEGYLPAPLPEDESKHYDETLVAALQRFQLDHGLQADGLLGGNTLLALNTPPQARLDQLRVNLERWRWLAADIEQETLLVDIAGGLLVYYRDGLPQWQARAQVGRANRQTPRLKSLVNRLTLNPTWTVPPTIFREDKLPQIRRDPDYLARQQMQVLDAEGNVLDPASVDWQRPRGIRLRQAAGPDNPLGKLVIRFPNPFAVYLHDTPSQQLFEKSPRTFSSGCVRIEGIVGLLDQILPAEDCQDIARRIARGRTEQVRIERRLPIVLAYWTAHVEEDGRLILRNDPYGLDAPLLAALNRPPH